jgi:hypothetical protein
MKVLYNITRFNLQNILKFPKRQSHKLKCDVYICNKRKWLFVNESVIYHSYQNNDVDILFWLPEDIDEYYDKYPISKFNSYFTYEKYLDLHKF